MDPQRVKEVFLSAAELPDRTAQLAYLEKACGDDTALRERVEDLLRSHDSKSGFLGTPAVPPADLDFSLQKTIDSSNLADTHRIHQEDETESLAFLGPSQRTDSLGRLGHYEVLQVLGKGGFGIVFRAFDDILQRVVAIKVLAPQLAATSPARKRFLREARTSAQVRHENVVQVYEVVEQPLPYLVMEYIPGETLQQRLDRTGPIDVAEILRIGRQIAEGLAAAHATDLIHRDIKPGNVLLEEGPQKVKITDFGLARAADDASMTQSGMIAGTPMYMAPEQALGHSLDQRADLFSLGTVLYQMAAGRPPFRANNTIAVLKRVVEDTPRPIREVIPEVPQWLCDIITKLHAKNPGDRYQSARDVADVLADCEAQLTVHAKLQEFSLIPLNPTAEVGARHREKWGAVALLLLVVLIGGSYFARRLLWSDPEVATNPPELAPPVIPVSTESEWVQLFNGKDLQGWKTHPRQPGYWRVADNFLIGSGPGHPGHLFTERGDYQDFHLRADVRINLRGDRQFDWADSGIYIRSPFNVDTGGSWATGYEAQIHVGDKTFGDATPIKTGSLGEFVKYDQPIPGVEAGAWFTMEVIARGNRITIKVNGITTVDGFEDNSFQRGHIALQQGSDATVVYFKKVEIKEFPASNSPTATKVADLNEPLPPTFTNRVGMEFVRVPKGKSWLGGGKDKVGEKEVEIPFDFYMGKYEVTQGEWIKLMGWNSSSCRFEDPRQYPVETVSWDACQVFISKLNALEKDTGWVYRLPTADEWEYACRGGPMSDRANSAFDYYLPQPTNTLLPEQANFHEEQTTRVGSYSANPLGLHDMHGNVHEWCLDLVLPDRVCRGGTWRYGAEECRAGVTSKFLPSAASRHLGLRLVRIRAGALPQSFKNNLGMEFVRVPKGKSWLGGGKNRPGEHEVEIPADFYLGKYEVTQEQWQQVMGANPSWFSRANADTNAVKDVTDADLKHFPVEAVTWEQCHVFLANLNSSERAAEGVYRLPTEEEWEYACRGGPMADKSSSTFDFYLAKPTHTLTVEQANFRNKDGVSRTCRVGSYEPNALGLYDMHGNVWEWCVASGKSSNDSTAIAWRGGSWNDSAADSCRAGNRWPERIAPTDQHFALGLRVVFVPRVATGFPSAIPTTPVTASTDAAVQRIATLPVAEQVEAVRQELKNRNPDFDGTFTPTIESDAITGLEFFTEHVSDISVLRALRRLTSVNLRGNGLQPGKVRDLTPLQGLSLTKLNISVTAAADLAFVRDMPLTHLYCDNTSIRDLTPLQGKRLQELNCSYTQVSSLEPLRGMPLANLWCNNTSIADLKPLAGMPLNWITLHATKVTDLSPLSGMPLTQIYLDYVPERDREILRSFPMLQMINDLPAAEFWKKFDSGRNE